MKFDPTKPRKMAKCSRRGCKEEAAHYGRCFKHFMEDLDKLEEMARHTRCKVDFSAGV